MMVAFGSITTLISPLSLIHHCDASGEGEAPPALAPAASRSLRQKRHRTRTDIDNAESALPEIISPLLAVVPPPIFSPVAVTASNRRMQSDESTSSTCLDNLNWRDKDSKGCRDYKVYNNCNNVTAEDLAGDMGPATEHCCDCGGKGIRTVSQNTWNEVRFMQCVTVSLIQFLSNFR